MALLDNTVANMYLLRRYNNVATTPPDRPLGDLLNSMAAAAGVSSSVRDLFVDPVNGNDDNNGLVATQVAGTNQGPVKTIQLAVLMFKLPLVQTWAYGADRVIHVKHTAGMPRIEEEIVIPPHAGSGVLRIEGEENVLFSGLIENGAFSAIAGFEAVQRLTFTTAPLTPNALAHAAFCRPRSRSLAANSIDACVEDLAIVANGAGTIDVVVADPGVFAAFHYGNGTVIDIVEAQIDWGIGAEPAGFKSTLQRNSITNMGSPLIVSGFCAQSGSASNSACFLSNIGNGVGTYGSNVVLNRVMAEADPGCIWRALTYGACMLAGITIVESVLYILTYSEISIAFSVDAQGTTTFNLAVAVQNAVIYGFLSTGVFGFVNSQTVADGIILVDVRNGDAQFTQHSTGAILALTVQGAGAQDALQVGTTADNCNNVILYDGSRVKGTTGNTQHGALVGIQSCLVVSSGTPTLSGTAGNVKVGALGPSAWGAGRVTDPDDLAIAII